METKKPELNEICPGLFSMKLNMMHTSNQAWIDNRKKALNNAKDKEHLIVQDVVELMVIVVDSPSQKRRNKATNIEKLERKIKHNPNHLNTLADLAVLNRNSNLPEKAAILEERINEILNSSDPNDIIEKAISVLEKGYAALFEDYTGSGIEAQQMLLESLQLIKVEQNTAVGKKKGVLREASNCILDARRRMFQALNCKTNDSFYDKNSSVELLEKGLQYLSNTSYSKEKYYIWKFYYAMAYSRMSDIEVATSNKTCISEKAVNLFWSVIENLSKDNECFSIYRARSYAYIGHILISTHKPSDAYPSYSSYENDKQFQALLGTPLSSFQCAYNELSNDEVVLSREGMSLWLLYKFGPAKNIEYLEKSERQLSSSILHNPYLRRFDFSTRMKVYLEMSSLEGIPLERREDLLKKALADGKTSVGLNLNARDVCKLAEICQRLAKFPNFYRNGPKAVTNIEYLHVALDYLNQCFKAKGQNYFTAYTFGSIYFGLGEFRTASEWHKRAFMISDFKLGNGNIKPLLFSILSLGEGSNMYVELIQVLTYIARKRKDVQFLRTLVPKVHVEDYLRSLLNFFIFLQTFPLTAEQVEIAETLKGCLIRKNVLKADQVGGSQYTITTTQVVEYDVKPEIVYQRVQMKTEPVDVQHNWSYDFCIITSGVNTGWVQCFLQHQLSTPMVDSDMIFTGFPGIDYDSCSTLLETTMNGIKKSRKSILVLSKDFLTREWCLLKQIILKTLQNRSDFLFIILLEKCDVPSEIDDAHLSYFDFTDEMRIPFETQHLKFALVEN
ncbi:Hypothetical predicted protein [Mytilus galloprovincialis]|uniref:TIR domain-containing protein n=1 Tax=Mytilus galloprovincialis TaxID=29158 RepID=A0A8B6CLY5_MYTGA|nr:Hypothetical predicted protein [Mytilus galloprovincialis]